ncbi:hypothetical protein MN032_18445 [Agromyces atrinae]|uniref:hypothetical protein n=1 Tax=Agromyces atrinae TaxID=592376 RepID=UPI001F570F98|nr:hypothetical protein [Agromyces atrinae]MCI2959668.1 hypothetical protein [Agromyces atrinae]
MSIDQRVNAFDAMARDLEKLRIESGPVSYAEIVTRIVDARIAAGATPGRAQIAKSTVYDVFRTGRSRVNPDLVEEIVLALGLDAAEAHQWRQLCIDARGERALEPAPTITPQPAPDLVAPAAERSALLRNPAMIAIIAVACVGLNNIGGQFVSALGVPLYLDMTGTAVAAVILGPWIGALVAVAHHVPAAFFHHDAGGMWFALVNVTGGLVWGYGVHAWRMGRTALRFFSLNVLAGFACTVVAVPILVGLFGGHWGHPAQDVLVPALGAVGVGIWESVTSVNLLISIGDKLFSGYLALLVAYALMRLGTGAPAGLEFGPFRPAAPSAPGLSEHRRYAGTIVQSTPARGKSSGDQTTEGRARMTRVGDSSERTRAAGQR